MYKPKKICSIEAFLKETKKDYEKWGLGEPPYFPWFRGEPACKTPLLPKLFRKKYKGDYFENRLLQVFRMKAPAIAYHKTPDRSDTDLWLFLAQHVGLSTRLLDWTEGALIALYFALKEKKPVVWMLNPFALNNISLKVPYDKNKLRYNIYGLTNLNASPHAINISFENIRAAWEGGRSSLDFPTAIVPTYLHPRMTAQRSCFTVHGNRKESLNDIFPVKNKNTYLQSYSIDFSSSRKEEWLSQLRCLGISHLTLFPEVDVLAGDLTQLFRPDLVSK